MASLLPGLVGLQPGLGQLARGAGPPLHKPPELVLFLPLRGRQGQLGQADLGGLLLLGLADVLPRLRPAPPRPWPGPPRTGAPGPRRAGPACASSSSPARIRRRLLGDLVVQPPGLQPDQDVAPLDLVALADS